MMSSSSTVTRVSSRLARQSSRTSSSFSLACFSLSRMAAAPSKSCSLMARSFSRVDLLDLGFELLDLGRAGHGADAGAGAGFVHHVDGLVRQETVGDVAVGELDRGLDGFVGELRPCGGPRISAGGP